MKKIFFTLGILVILIVFLVLLTIIYLPFQKQSNGSVEFSKEVWNDNYYDRGAMVKDLLEKYDFTSMKKGDVITLLGESRLTVIDYDDRIGSGFLDYEIFGGFLNDEILMFKFDELGQIVYAGIRN